METTLQRTRDETIVALTPEDMGPAQQALGEWCVSKKAELEAEFKELEEHQLIAVANGWKLTSLRNSLNRTAKRIDYYEKMRLAVEAGYLMVPNFPVTLLAVRVDRETSRVKGSSSWARNFNVAPDLLPAGQGRYVDNEVGHIDASHTTSDGNGGTKRVSEFIPADEMDEPDFPIVATKPIVMQATAQAMAKRIFDEIGMVENTSGRDPIMVGRLRDPRGNGRVSTFFIAWWLDTRTL